MEKIQKHIYRLKGLIMGNVYVIEASDGLTLVDTSKPNSVSRIQKSLQHGGYQLSDIKRILITHAHWDHFGSLAELHAITGAKVYAHHRYESEVIRGEKMPRFASPSQLGGFNRLVSKYWLKPMLNYQIAVPVHVELTEGDRLDEVFPGLEVIDLPGHSPGHCGFWLEDQRILIGGDILMNLPSDRPTLPLIAATPDLITAKQSVRKIDRMNVETLCLGHGKPIIRNAAAKIRKIVNSLN
ncbi:MBL fold metallo-hydrolase [Shimazuella sp. AN120528]|uniref:MBL fold metallo-hydrolase n=1 Tax=Shimazuella soli TaxID=1892854 RepID=UPI001F0F55AE|nr:MBL fold metallo-hydrolase [Shimazuella soli]MCH5584431.1 MBL fold metallo-hydrolase [Shimazuella soli]